MSEAVSRAATSRSCPEDRAQGRRRSGWNSFIAARTSSTSQESSSPLKSRHSVAEAEPRGAGAFIRVDANHFYGMPALSRSVTTRRRAKSEGRVPRRAAAVERESSGMIAYAARAHVPFRRAKRFSTLGGRIDVMLARLEERCGGCHGSSVVETSVERSGRASSLCPTFTRPNGTSLPRLLRNGSCKDCCRTGNQAVARLSLHAPWRRNRGSGRFRSPALGSRRELAS